MFCFCVILLFIFLVLVCFSLLGSQFFFDKPAYTLVVDGNCCEESFLQVLECWRDACRRCRRPVLCLGTSIKCQEKPLRHGSFNRFVSEASPTLDGRFGKKGDLRDVMCAVDFGHITLHRFSGAPVLC